MDPNETTADDIVWCPGCGYEEQFDAVPLGAATFGTCPECHHDLHTVPKNASDEYRELLHRF